METLVDISLLAILAITAMGIARLRNLFAVVMLSGVYSLVSAALFVTLDAVDVAFTEAAVGAGVSTVLMLGTLALTTSTEKKPNHSAWLPLFVVTITGAALIYGLSDVPPYGDPSAPANLHVAPRYLEGTITEIGLPNAVTSILASYRGFDTLGETGVIFTAGVGVMLLLANRRRRKKEGGTK